MLLIFDGANGTELQKNGVKIGEVPELLNITNPKAVLDVHKAYIKNGSDVISLNTLNANSYKLKDTKYSVNEVIKAAVKLSEGLDCKRALDIGPIGKMLAPIGTMSFDEAYEIYKEMILAAKEDVDIILFETATDLYELKAGILAAKENCDLPIYVTMTFDEKKRTLTGSDPLTFVNVVEGLGVDVLGVNCSLGPKQLLPIVKDLVKYSSIPVMVQANAGMPKLVDGKTIFNIEVKEYVDAIDEMINIGVRIIGGCCGTTPEFIKEIHKRHKNVKDIKIVSKKQTYVTSGVKSVLLGEGIVVCGERINPTGRKKIKRELLNENYDQIVKEAIIQEDANAHILDVNVGVPTIDEVKTLKEVIEKIQEVVNTPLQIDSSNKKAIANAIRYYNGVALINSVDGKQKSMDAIFPIAKKYGAVVVALTLDEEGIPLTAEKRIKIAKKIVKEAQKYGIETKNLIFDALVLTASAQQEAVKETFIAVRKLKKIGLKTVLGVSNVSFGLPNRALLNRTFLAACLSSGLDMAIINPLDKEMMGTIDAHNVLYNVDKDSFDYIRKQTVSDVIVDKKSMTLYESILKGFKEESIVLVKKELANTDPVIIVDKIIIPALNDVGDRFGKGTLFLPQLIQSAETVKGVFSVIAKKFKNSDVKKGPIIMATVYGDVHDIGKNIVKVVLESYGYLVIDLGKDVSTKVIIEAFNKHKPKAIGLSALMTTTVDSMQKTIAELKSIPFMCSIWVGGAVLTSDIANKIGADYYAKDALETVKIAKKVIG